MVVESMTDKEIIFEYNKDWYSEIAEKVACIISKNNQKYRRYIMQNLRSEQHFYFKPIFLTSKRGNNYVLHISTRGWADYKKNNVLFLIYMYYKKKDGIHVIMPNWKSDSYVIESFIFYTSHLFDRYREREMKDVHIPKMDAIIECMKWNCTTRHKETFNEKYPNSIFIASPYGVMLGTLLDGGNKIMKTYLSFDMLRGQQNDDKDELKEMVLEYMKHLQ